MNFTVTVYHGDDPDEDAAFFGDKLIHFASHLGSTTVSATDEREAAAKAWIQIVGRVREERLKKLDAPTLIVAHQTDVGAIFDELRTTAVDTALYELYNGAEVWYFRVDSIAEANRFEKTGCDTVRDASGVTPAAIDIEKLLTPSPN